MTDPDIAPVRKWINEERGRPPSVDIAHHSPATKAYWAQWKTLFEKRRVLLRTFYCVEAEVFYPQILLPSIYHNAVMEQMHDGLVGRHFGVMRTLACLKTRYY